MAIREGRWRCPYCATVNRGRDLACTGCGATRDADVAFFLEDDAPELLEQTLIAQARAGADWLCAFCRTSNRPGAARCANCGAERAGAPSRGTRELRGGPLPSGVSPPPARYHGPLAAVVGLALLLAALLGFLALRTTEESVSVTDFQWTRAIEVEAFRKVRESAWDGELPPGARVLSRSREVHHTERVPAGTERVKVGTRDLGNGFFEDVYAERPVYQEHPVYRERLGYEVERWVGDRTERASGNDQIPRWPLLRLGRQEREARRSETYIVLLKGRRIYMMELPYERWFGLRAGETRTAVIRGGRRLVALR